MDWDRFLALARCPAPHQVNGPCRGELHLRDGEVVCRMCAATYTLEPQTGVPYFAPRTTEDLAADKYEDPAQRLAEGYMGLWAYGYLFVGRGESEGFYRTMNELGFSTRLAVDGSHHILEIGCGVGRTSCDYACHYPNALIVGIEYSPRLLTHAYRMVVGDQPGERVAIGLEREGYGEVTQPAFSLRNAFFAQANALQLPFADEQFDLVITPNLIDRVSDPLQMIREAGRVTKPGGYFILADPFNWAKQPEWWARCRSLDDLTAILKDSGLRVDVAFDGLVYREVLDARGAYTEWPVAVVRATKP